MKKIIILLLLFGISIKAEIITPHTKWAKPYFKGKTKLIIICPEYSKREIIELSQRFDFEITHISFPFSDKSIEKMDEECDGIIIGGIKWTSIPENIRKKIVDKVKNGNGLLFIDPQGLDREIYTLFKNGKIEKIDEYILFCIPFSKISKFSGLTEEEFSKKYIEESKIGNGIVYFINWESGRGDILFLTPNCKCNFVEYDYFISLIGKLILKMCNKLPDMKINGLVVEKERLKFLIEGQFDKDMKIYGIIKDKDGIIENKFETDKKEYLIPVLPSGIHFIDVFLKKGDKIIDWRSTYIDKPNTCEINIKLDKDFYKEGEEINVEMEIKGVNEGEVYVFISDSLGRIISKQNFPLKEKINFKFSSFQPITILHYLKVEVYNKEILIDKKEISFPIKKKNDMKDFHFVIWGSPSENYLLNYPVSLLHNLGVDTLHCYCNEIETLKEITKNNLIPSPYIYSLKAHSKGKDNSRHPCFSDPNFRKQMEENLIKKTKIIYPYSPLCYSLGDENELSHWSENYEFCFSKYCLDGFREYLKGRYRTIENLNKEWETDFKTWEEVIPKTLKEMKDKNEIRNFSSWIEHRMYMESVFADIHNFGKNIIEKIDENSYVGAEGLWGEGNSFTGSDFYKLSKAMNSIGGYGGTSYYDTFLPDDRFLWDWGIYVYDVNAGKRYPWDRILRGANGVGYFSVISSELEWSAFNPDFSLTPPFKAIVEECQKLKEGIGKLLISSDRKWSPIAILHSQPNLHLTTAIKEKTYFDYLKAKDIFTKIFEEMWYYPDFIDREELEKGILKEGKYKCLILPSIFCLSDKEIEEIEGFVKEGGIVISDVLPGLFDECGKIRENNKTEELFGIKRINWQGGTEIKNFNIENKNIKLIVPERLSLKTADSLLPQQKEIFFINYYGKGKFICMNLLLTSIENLKAEEKNIFYNYLFSLFKNIGLNPIIEVYEKETGNIFFSGVSRIFASERINYLLILPSKNGKVNIKLPEKKFLYNIIEKKYIGETNQFETEFDSNLPVLVSIMDYKVNTIEAKIKNKGNCIDGEVKIIPEGDISPSSSVVRVSVFDKEQELKHLSKNIICKNGKGKFLIPVALNEKIDKIEIIDVATGIKKEIKTGGER